MSRNARFHYGLEPVLLTRQWDLDALLRDLGQSNAQCSEAEQGVARMRQLVAAAAAQWNGLSGEAGHLSVGRFTVLASYLRDQQSQLATADAELAVLLAERDDLIDKVVLSQRGVEAVEEHREQMQAQFVKVRMSGEFKIADDQWNTLQARIVGNDS